MVNIWLQSLILVRESHTFSQFFSYLKEKCGQFVHSVKSNPVLCSVLKHKKSPDSGLILSLIFFT